MITYQFGYMYGRYLMWNFVGRQNDVQGNLDIENGNWLSGIGFLDEMRLGPQHNLPTDAKENKGEKYLLLFAVYLRNHRTNFSIEKRPK